MQIQYSIFTYPVIQSRGEEQGRATGGGEASGRKEQRAGEGTDLGGLGRLQGGAATGGGRVPCREADGSLQGGGREADGSPAGGGRATGPLQGGGAAESAADRGPAGRRED